VAVLHIAHLPVRCRVDTASPSNDVSSTVTDLSRSGPGLLIDSMTEWWVSQKKNFCEYCKVWTGGHLWQVRKHEEGRMHQEKKELYLKNSRQRLKDKEREEEDVKRQLEDIEKAAHAAMGMDSPGSVVPVVVAAKEKEDRSVRSTLGLPSLEVAKEKEAIQKTIDKAQRKRKEPGIGCDGGRAAGATAGPTAPSAPAPASAAMAPVPAAEGSPWLVCTDPTSGHVYYYNKSTSVSSWEKPADLGVDLSKPPPPPSTKPPPPPKRKGPDAAPGMWEEVKPEESMWHNPDEFRRAIATRGDDSDEECVVNPLGELKQEMKGRKGQWAQEDLEKRDIEIIEKRSNTQGNASFGGARKKAGGIRKKREED